MGFATFRRVQNQISALVTHDGQSNVRGSQEPQVLTQFGIAAKFDEVVVDEAVRVASGKEQFVLEHDAFCTGTWQMAHKRDDRSTEI
jgi:hypothetical protein